MSITKEKIAEIRTFLISGDWLGSSCSSKEMTIKITAALDLAESALWRPIEEAPKDGTVVVGEEWYRFQPYKPGAPKKLLASVGRWQKWNGYGGWDNCEAIQAWRPCRPITPPEGDDQS